MKQIIIVSGRSGSGKTSVLNILEDFGYYVIDNLPLSLIPSAISELKNNSRIHNIALGVDARALQGDLSEFGALYDSLITQYGETVRVLYVTAQESVLVARFGATRRVHPLMATMQTLPNAIAHEIKILEPIAMRADIKIDTSTLNTHELKEKVRQHLGVDNVVSVNVMSFGFKYGAPIDADYVFDVRILPNPHWQEHLRVQTGQDDDIKRYFAKYPEVDAMAADIGDFLLKWLPSFLNNNRYSVTVAIGCTGGKHRSVYIADEVGKRLQAELSSNMPVVIKHREQRHW